jgi:general secretion pathway protein G
MRSPSFAGLSSPGLTPHLSAAGCAPALRSRRDRRSAFTLLEIMIALAILGMLVAVLITNVGKSLDTAKVGTAKVFVQDSMKTPLLTYKIQIGNYPTTEQGLQALVAAPPTVADRWAGPYVDLTGGKLPLDPWNNPYQYAYPGVHNKDGYDLWSMGPNGKSGDEDDIGNW